MSEGMANKNVRTQAVLSFALVDSEPVFARAWVDTAPRSRPAAVCPCCLEAVTWKAGDVKVPHVAHRPDSVCAATRGESAAHLNAKAALASILARGSRVWIRLRCRCGTPVRAIWSAPGWIRAETEYRVGSRRPDVALLDGTAVVAAVEVLHTHAVDEEKRAEFGRTRVRWIETTSREALRWASAVNDSRRPDDQRSLHVWAGDEASLSVRCSACARKETP